MKLTKGLRATIGEMTLLSNPNKNDDAPKAMQHNTKRELIVLP